jgi:hypothetical protein
MFYVWQSGLNLWNKLNDMEVTVKNEKANKVLDFPKLMISKEDGSIVLFTSNGVGACIYPLDDIIYHSKLANSYTTWEMDYFTDFKGEITIKQ